MIVGALTGVVLATPTVPLLTRGLDGWVLRLVAFVATMAVLAGAGAWLGRLRWRHTRWKLDVRGFHVRRGWLVRTEILVPRSRVQHLDLERGPLERYVGLATLVIHTAGSQTPALRQAGLADADAVSLRDALLPPANHDDAL
jgi:membrane protein YdbS with pleckstrin-like domain